MPLPIVERTNKYEPGSLVFVRRSGPFSRLIAFGQLRRQPKDFAYWTHVAVVVTPAGDIVEALSQGVCLTHISKYRSVPHLICERPTYDQPPEVLANVVKFARHAVGRSYGWAEIASLFCYLLTGTKLRAGLDNQMVCSGLASEALSRTSAIFPHEPMFMMPADLAAYYEVKSPAIK